MICIDEYVWERIQRIESTFSKFYLGDIYMVPFIIYSFTRFNHLLYITIYIYSFTGYSFIGYSFTMYNR